MGDMGMIHSVVELAIGAQRIFLLGNWKAQGCQYQEARARILLLWLRWLLLLVLALLLLRRLLELKLLKEMGMGMIGHIVSARVCRMVI